MGEVSFHMSCVLDADADPSFEMTGSTKVSTCALQAPPGLSSLTEPTGVTFTARASLVRRCGDSSNSLGTGDYKAIEKVTFLAFHLYPWNTCGGNDRTHVLKIAPGLLSLRNWLYGLMKYSSADIHI